MMEQLFHYLKILRRFWVLVLALPLLVGIISLGAGLTKPQRYRSQARVLLSQAPYQQEQVLPFPDINLLNSWQGSEFILDDVPSVVRSRALAEDVSAWLASTSRTDDPIDPALIQASLDGEKFHRTVTLTSIASNPDLSIAFLEGAIAALQSRGLAYWGRSSEPGGGLSVAVLDPPTPAQPLNSARSLVLNVGARSGLALAAAVGLAFLLHSLDDTLRDPSQVEAWVGLQVVGMIPEE
ncbi:MAG: hypothetical protein HC884_13310 [Chloroflexaceae bacterium]|nr:hypothetical protein [Chloroflexaceae bacterium]